MYLVIRDITSVLFDTKFIERLTIGNERKQQIIPEHCKIILHDIACCSLMRLDEISMNKLWDLITMIFKWQLHLTNKPQHLLDITFRHLDGIMKLYSNHMKSKLIDSIKNYILDYWNLLTLQIQYDIYENIKLWLNGFNVKISILIRLGFQNVDGKFLQNIQESYYHNYIENIGENIYERTAKIDENEIKEWQKSREEKNCDDTEGKRKLGEEEFCGSNKFENFTNQLNIRNEKNNEDNLVIFNDVLLQIKNNDDNSDNAIKTVTQDKRFIQIKAAHSSNSTWENLIGKKTDLKTLLDTKF